MKVAVIDADLVGRNKHRFPNLACMKIANYHKSLGDEVTLKLNYDVLETFDKVYLSKVFSDTSVPEEVTKMSNVIFGGTGFYYDKAPKLPDEIEHCMPDYHLYDEWVAEQLAAGNKRVEYKYYLDYSIGFLTRGCFRKCKFCVNQNYDRVNRHSPLEEFFDPERKKICLLDDNFLGCPSWKEMLLELQATGKPFQFKQGLDERILTDEKCKLLFDSKYDGDYTFAFDNVADAKLIKSKLRLARKYTNVVPKFYCFTGFDRNDVWDDKFWYQDILDLFTRIEILMRNKCLPYVMRFSRYEESPYRGLYITIARWCNQPSFFKKKSLREFGIANGMNSACYRYLSDFEKKFPEVAYFYDLKFGGEIMGKTTTEMKLVQVSKLVPYVNNARTHSPEQVNKLRSSLREFGFVNPVIIDGDYNVIAGHGRLMAAKEEGIEEVPCVLVDYLSEAQKKAYIIADNRMAMDAGWNEELLRVEIEALQGEDFDLSLTGFDEKELLSLFDCDDSEAQEDGFDVDAELQKPCFCRAGDVWHIGKHTVICADSTEPETYKKLLGDTKVNLVCTDPPYMVNLESTSGRIRNDDLNDKDAYEFLLKAFSRFHEAMTRDASIYVFYATAKARVFHDAYEDAGFKVGAGLVWKKDRLVLTRTDWKYIHEPIIWGWKKDGKHIWYGDQKQQTVFEFARIKSSKEDGFGHPSSKPVPLLAYLIGLCTQSNGIVLDGFLGSASTLIACEQLGRICYGVELEAKFVDVAVNRYIAYKEGTADDVYVVRDGEKIMYSDVPKEGASDDSTE